MVVNMHEAKTNLSRLVERALAGERVVLARNGKELLVLQPLEAAKDQKRSPGLARGKGLIAEDFDAPLDSDILSEFE